MSTDLLGKTIALALAIFAVGTLLCLPLYAYNLRKFVGSRLFIKICLWIPIFLVFLAVLFLGNGMRAGILGVIYLLCLKEFVKNFQKAHAAAMFVYFLIFSFAFAHFILFGLRFDNDVYVSFMITICFASVLSDVCAFFLGTYYGRHKLPEFLNNSKSWEGVLGQIIGATLGIALTSYFVIGDISPWLIVTIGVGSATGDLLNSYIKRKLNIKDWSQAIPGHGGYLDRLASLVFAVMFSYYILFFVN